MTTMTLAQPVRDGDGEVATLTFRRPIGRDVRTCGIPFSVGTNGDMVFDGRACAKLIAALTNQPEFVIDQLDAADWMEAQTILLGFFGGTTPKP